MKSTNSDNPAVTQQSSRLESLQSEPSTNPWESTQAMGRARSADHTLAQERSEADKLTVEFREDPERTAMGDSVVHGTGWVSATETVSVAGRDIGGMVYVGKPPKLNDHGYWHECRAYIDPSLTVAEAGLDKAGGGLPYWPGYSDISAQCRATYLNWLADGRSDASYNPGYMFMYFYGLERCFFVDQSDTDFQVIISEVRRLRSLYSDSHSVQRYLGEFLDIALLHQTKEVEREPVFERYGWDLPFSLKFAIGKLIDRGERLNANWLLSWFVCHPESNLRTAATRCEDEFHALFKVRFHQRFPEGLNVSKPRNALSTTYQAASSEFEVEINPKVSDRPIPDISGLCAPIEIAQEIANDAMDDLDKLSRYLGRNPTGRGSLEAQALVPKELWNTFPCEELEELRTWAAAVVSNGGLIAVTDVVERLEGSKPDQLSKESLTGVADALARVGFGFAPDPRFALRSPKIDEPVVLFELGEVVPKLEHVSDQYRTALIEAAMSSFVASADGQITESERKALVNIASELEDLSVQERRRLTANIEWMLAVPPDLTSLRRKLKNTGPEAQSSVRSALITAAHADGAIQPEEVSRIEGIYRVLGLDPQLVYSDLHAGDVVDGPVQVRIAELGLPGETIPSETSQGRPRLDAARVAAIKSDTQRVSAVLGEIFNDGVTASEDRDAGSAALAGLDELQTNFVRELIGKEHWTEEAFQEICTRSGLLASGVVEHINEWAFEVYEEVLLEEYDGYEVSPDLAEKLRKRIEEETGNVRTETP